MFPREEPAMTALAIAPPRVSAWPLLIAGTVCVGFAPVLVRFAASDPTASAFWRMSLALPFAALWLAVPTAERATVTRRDLFWLAAAGFAFAGDLASMHQAIQLSSVANATFLTNLAPVLVVPAAWLLFAQRPRDAMLAALPLAVLGALLMSRDTATRGGDPAGDLFGVLAAVFFAAYLLIVQLLRRRIGAALVMVGTSAAAAPTLLALALLEGAPLLPAVPQGWVALLALGVVSQAIGQGLTAAALGRLPVGPASVVLLLQPLLTAALAWPLVHEAPTALQVLGAVVVLAAVMLARR
jgi:drug/metabolite transporter (DMT)-like permease